MADPNFVVDVEAQAEVNGQIYFNLEKRQVVAQNGVYDWDLAFDCREGKFSILLNSAKAMAAFNTKIKNFEHKFITQQYPWRFDHPCGDLDQTCIGEWGDFSFANPQSYSEVYLINLGLYGRKTPIGFRKIQVIKYQDSSYIFQFANLNGMRGVQDTIKKDPRYNFVYYSFQNGGEQVEIEPQKDDWDIMVSPYVDETRPLGPFDIPINEKYALFDGISQNRYKRRVATDSSAGMDEINYFDLNQYIWTANTNEIGNTWNWWEAKDSSYHIHKSRSYVVRNGDRFYLLGFEDYEKTDQFTSKFRFRVKRL